MDNISFLEWLDATIEYTAKFGFHVGPEECSNVETNTRIATSTLMAVRAAYSELEK